MIKHLLLISVLFFFNGCVSKPSYDTYVVAQDTQHTHDNLLSTIEDISNQLFTSKNEDILEDGLILTSFTWLDNLDKTTPLGKLLSESMINELHNKGFKVIDFRGRDYIKVNKTGEFFITRDSKSLRKEMASANILVGTYSAFDQNTTLVNTRILNFKTGEVLSTAKVVYTINDCKLLDNCKKPVKKPIKKIVKKPVKKIAKPISYIDIIEDK